MSNLSAFLLLLLLVASSGPGLCFGHQSGSCPFHGSDDHDHDHDHHGHHHHHDHGESLSRSKALPEELAEEEDLKVLEFESGRPHHGHDHSHGGGEDVELSKIGLWIHSMGCSLLVSMASLVCLIILPVIFYQGKPSKMVVDSLAVFGAGAMLGDAFLHQLPHAFGGEQSHSHDHHSDHVHDEFHNHGHGQSHSHSLKDLSVGLSILSGIVLFLMVEKVVRYVEAHSSKGTHGWGHVHHHHHHRKSSDDLKDDEGCSDNANTPLIDTKKGSMTKMASESELIHGEENFPRKRSSHGGPTVEDEICSEAANGSVTKETPCSSDAANGSITKNTPPSSDAASGSVTKKSPLAGSEPARSPSSLVFGYLNLFSDGVHNFTDGMALGSAFLLYGSVGGWSRTLFLLAHELPQEVGDFGILVRSGFSVSKALFFNFLSALSALAGTALGFTAGGFIYIAVAGVLPEMNNGKATVKSTVIQLTSLISGMAVALCISLVE
ncbi:IAA-alanine resistance protein 1 isoform X2 [Magnolia sinica]|uniref:IAA-alanine resistance protein 1 isoform X2 n=1 Tax=Magnolia sinica TaxID=86752 RepID=UPI002657CAEB|nr:IAA-alanine resistance protein 1 isoform X2 [Magnolia sinica]